MAGWVTRGRPSAPGDGAVVELSRSDARRLALRAQGFGGPRVEPDLARVVSLVDQLNAIQIDAVNVLVRAHYLPIFSRLGAYDRRLLDRATFETGQAFEYAAGGAEGHAASVVSTELYPALRWRMAEHATNKYWVSARQAIEGRQPGYVARVLEEVAERGPLGFKDLTDPARHPRPQTKYAESTILWWSNRPSDGKAVLEGLCAEGKLAVAGRGAGFERLFDLPERVLPASTLAAPPLERGEAQRQLLLRAARALGVGWLKDFARFFGLPIATTKTILRSLVGAGLLQAAIVEGNEEPAYLDPAARAEPLQARALLGVFDSVLWERSRTVRLFDFRHSFELFVPEPKRRYGYYVLPFLLGESLVARVDLRAERATGTLRVYGAFAEAGTPGTVGQALADELRDLAGWLELERIEVGDRGDLGPSLRRILQRSRRTAAPRSPTTGR